MNKEMRVLLADDQAKVRSALWLLLEQEPGLRVVGEAVEAEELLTRTEMVHPDLVLLDWELPDLRAGDPSTAPGLGSRRGGGEDLLSSLRALHPHLRVIALSSQPEARQSALVAGVDAFVSKGDPPEQLLAVISGCLCKQRSANEE